MKQVLAIVLAAVACSLASTVAFWAGTRAGPRDPVVVDELRLQRELLATLSGRLAELSDRSNQPPRPCVVAAVGGSTLDPATLEAAVRKAIDAQAEQVSAKQEAAARPTEENLKAFSHGQDLIGNALAAGRWTDADATAWRESMGRLTAEQHAELMRQLSVAINQGKLSVRTSGPPF